MPVRSLAFAASVLLCACFTPPVETDGPLLTEEAQLCSAKRVCTQSADCCTGYFCDHAGYGPARCSPARNNGAYCYEDSQCRSRICVSAACVQSRAPKACVAIAHTCAADSDCCSGSFCDDLLYGPHKCEALRPHGGYCATDGQCQSGNCQAGVCANAVCGNAGTSCSVAGDCCTGTFCDNLGYGPRKCEAPRSNGGSCSDATQCESGNCKAGICVSASCGSVDEACTTAGDCCGGTFCNNFTYGIWRCTAPQPNGFSCIAAKQCQSGSCAAGICAATSCVGAGTTCATNADCCAGTFCFNYTYAPWVCKSALATGSYCHDDAQCQSSHCVSSLCAAAACASTGDTCQGDTDCCTASYCKVGSPYLSTPNLCTAAGSANGYCNTNRQCVSLSCVNHACGP